jgi:hypothetical protein
MGPNVKNIEPPGVMFNICLIIDDSLIDIKQSGEFFMNELFAITSDDAVKRRRNCRDDIERLLDRAAYLSGHDRVFIEQVYRHGVSLPDVSRLSGQAPRRLRQRLARLMKRMNSPLFVFLVQHGMQLPEPLRRTGELVVLEGNSLRRAGFLSEQSLHRVREHLRTLQTLSQL